MTTSPEFWNKMAGKYARQPVADEAAYQHKLARTREHLTPEMSVLEFGCGTGSTAITHAPHVKSIHAIDYSSEMISIARDKAQAQGVANVTFEVDSINTLNTPEQSFDAVLGMSILHLLPNRPEVLSKVHRLVKPGGYFFSSTTCLRDANPMIPLVIPIMRMFGKAPYVGMFTDDELLAEIKAAGFSIEENWRPKKSAALFVVAKKPAI